MVGTTDMLVGTTDMLVHDVIVHTLPYHHRVLAPHDTVASHDVIVPPRDVMADGESSSLLRTLRYHYLFKVYMPVYRLLGCGVGHLPTGVSSECRALSHEEYQRMKLGIERDNNNRGVGCVTPAISAIPNEHGKDKESDNPTNTSNKCRAKNGYRKEVYRYSKSKQAYQRRKLHSIEKSQLLSCKNMSIPEEPEFDQSDTSTQIEPPVDQSDDALQTTDIHDLHQTEIPKCRCVFIDTGQISSDPRPAIAVKTSVAKSCPDFAHVTCLASGGQTVVRCKSCPFEIRCVTSRSQRNLDGCRGCVVESFEPSPDHTMNPDVSTSDCNQFPSKDYHQCDSLSKSYSEYDSFLQDYHECDSLSRDCNECDSLSKDYYDCDSPKDYYDCDSPKEYYDCDSLPKDTNECDSLLMDHNTCHNPSREQRTAHAAARVCPGHSVGRRSHTMPDLSSGSRVACGESTATLDPGFPRTYNVTPLGGGVGCEIHDKIPRCNNVYLFGDLNHNYETQSRAVGLARGESGRVVDLKCTADSGDEILMNEDGRFASETLVPKRQLFCSNSLSCESEGEAVGLARNKPEESSACPAIARSRSCSSPPCPPITLSRSCSSPPCPPITRSRSCYSPPCPPITRSRSCSSSPCPPITRSRSCSSSPCPPITHSRSCSSAPCPPITRSRSCSSSPCSPITRSRSCSSSPCPPITRSRSCSSSPCPPIVRSRSCSSPPRPPIVRSHSCTAFCVEGVGWVAGGQCHFGADPGSVRGKESSCGENTSLVHAENVGKPAPTGKGHKLPCHNHDVSHSATDNNGSYGLPIATGSGWGRSDSSVVGSCLQMGYKSKYLENNPLLKVKKYRSETNLKGEVIRTRSDTDSSSNSDSDNDGADMVQKYRQRKLKKMHKLHQLRGFHSNCSLRNTFKVGLDTNTRVWQGGDPATAGLAIGRFGSCDSFASASNRLQYKTDSSFNFRIVRQPPFLQGSSQAVSHQPVVLRRRRKSSSSKRHCSYRHSYPSSSTRSDVTSDRDVTWKSGDAALTKCRPHSMFFQSQKNDRQEILRKLAMAPEEEPVVFDADKALKKSNIQSRFQHGQGLQVCFMNEQLAGSANQSAAPPRPEVDARHNAAAPGEDINIEEIDDSNGDLKTRQQRLQHEATIALAQVRPMAHMQLMVEKRLKKKSPLADIVGIPGLGDDTILQLTPEMLQAMNLAQLQVVVNDLHSQIESLNIELMNQLVERDDLHMEQDSMLVDIEDLHRRAEELSLKVHSIPGTPKKKKDKKK